MAVLRFLGDMFSPTQFWEDMTTGWTWASRLWLIAAPLAVLAISLHWGESLVAILSSVTGIICVILVAKGKIINYAFGLVNVILYGWVAYNATYYGDAALNWLFYLPVQFVGFYYWSRRYTHSTETVIMRRMTVLQWTISALVIAGSVVGFAAVLGYFGDRLPWHDSFSTVVSVAAMILMIARYREQWLGWIAVNVVSVYMWVSYTMAGEGTGIAALMMWMVFLANSVYGWWIWSRLAKQHEIEDIEPVESEHI